jgi:cyclophilin family peptidyl-prolyl cis-trans isomerase
MKQFLFLLTIASAVLFSCTNSKKTEQREQKESTAVAQKIDTMNIVKVEEPVFDIKTNLGTIRVKLYKETPLHRDNFIKLASQRFYDGILFHRVIRGFMIQAGDPNTKDPQAVATYGQGGPGYTVPAEILPQFKHKKGALAAARKPDTANPSKASSGSQFYIVVDADVCAQLNGDYTVFGETISGFDVIDKIASVPTGQRDIPVEPVQILSVTQVLEK